MMRSETETLLQCWRTNEWVWWTQRCKQHCHRTKDSTPKQRNKNWYPHENLHADVHSPKWKHLKCCWVEKQNVGSNHTVENHWASEEWSPDTHAMWMSREHALRERSHWQRPQVVGCQFHKTSRRETTETESRWRVRRAEARRGTEFVLGVMKMSQKWIVAVVHNSMNT